MGKWKSLVPLEEFRCVFNELLRGALEMEEWWRMGYRKYGRLKLGELSIRNSRISKFYEPIDGADNLWQCTMDIPNQVEKFGFVMAWNLSVMQARID
ncbi:hypothetical protein FACS1894126_0270 [Alphaproteobacteria bacterium]|nr:hypothetical protein FACS1894126_0270 [Alphaproteobacteria bacterium]